MSYGDFFIFFFVAIIFGLGIYVLIKLRKVSRRDRAEMQARNEEKRKRKAASESTETA